jgi:DNA-binding MarR family transcriptional regulator
MTRKSDDEISVCIDLLIPAARIASRDMSEVLTPLGLTPAQFAVLLLLERRGEVRSAEISSALDVETSTMAVTLQRAEKAGFVERIAHPSDGRASLIRLTDEGRAIIPVAVAATRAVEATLLASLTEDMVAAMIVALKRFREADV